MLSSTGELVHGTVLNEDANGLKVSFLMPPEIQEMFIHIFLIVTNCAGKNFSETMGVGTVLNLYDKKGININN